MMKFYFCKKNSISSYYFFFSYELKEWQGLRLISHYGFLDKVPNHLDGKWWEVLKNSCHFYLTHYGEGNLIKSWLMESQNVTSILCRYEKTKRENAFKVI